MMDPPGEISRDGERADKHPGRSHLAEIDFAIIASSPALFDRTPHLKADYRKPATLSSGEL
jgi:hypothetical protein